MSEELERLAVAHGILVEYEGETGEARHASDDAMRGILAALDVPATTVREIARSLEILGDSSEKSPTPTSKHSVGVVSGGQAAGGRRCYMPGWLSDDGVWGLTCQLYSLRSERNAGIGDFEDLATLAELAGERGADFLGISPLHCLFPAAPERCSPYAPSSRAFLNPLYIALDRLSEVAADAPGFEAVRQAKVIDYKAVAALKLGFLEQAFAAFRTTPEFDTFCHAGGARLKEFATFEAISEAMTAEGFGAGWRSWPAELTDKTSVAVGRLALKLERRVRFHEWLQWVAAQQLIEAQRRALAAGMRIGLYVDLAIGVAPDGADTWRQPQAIMNALHIGAPPDLFNAEGQDWGLAPISPKSIEMGTASVFAEALEAVSASAGAIRIDHVMGLGRLYLIPENLSAVDGAYLSYPVERMVADLAEVSERTETIVIGEDLGTVDEDFRNLMAARDMQGCRVVLFERGEDLSFLLPHDYPAAVLASFSTHDLPTLRGWWTERDLDTRSRLGFDETSDTEVARGQRRDDRHRLIDALEMVGSLSVSRKVADRHATLATLYPQLVRDVHHFLARTKCRLAALQIEDAAGMVDAMNLPGTVDEHPNWQRRLPLSIAELAASSTFRELTDVLAAERSRSR